MMTPLTGLINQDILPSTVVDWEPSDLEICNAAVSSWELARVNICIRSVCTSWAGAASPLLLRVIH